MFLQGRGLNSSYAIFQDATGRAKERVIALGIAVGSGVCIRWRHRATTAAVAASRSERALVVSAPLAPTLGALPLATMIAVGRRQLTPVRE